MVAFSNLFMTIQLLQVITMLVLLRIDLSNVISLQVAFHLVPEDEGKEWFVSCVEKVLQPASEYAHG